MILHMIQDRRYLQLRICSFLEGLGINSQSSDLVELAVKELWWAATCFELILSLEEVYLHPRHFEIGSC